MIYKKKRSTSMVNIVDIKRGQQLYSIDFTKFIMAIFVIAIHTHPLEPVTNKFILNFYNELVGLAVPFFFITNGYLLFKNKDIKSSSEMIATVKKFAIKMAKLYIMWSAIYLPLAIYDYISQGRSVIKSVVTYIGKLVLVGDHYLSWPLWYLLSAIYAAVVLYFVIYKFGLNKKILLGSAVMFFGLDIFLTYIVNNQANLKWGGGNTSLKNSSENYTEWQDITRPVLYTYRYSFSNNKKEKIF